MKAPLTCIGQIPALTTVSLPPPHFLTSPRLQTSPFLLLKSQVSLEEPASPTVQVPSPLTVLKWKVQVLTVQVRASPSMLPVTGQEPLTDKWEAIILQTPSPPPQPPTSLLKIKSWPTTLPLMSTVPRTMT